VLVVDRVNGVAYVDISERAHRDLAERWVDEMGYKDLVAFRSTDMRGKSVYHTNVSHNQSRSAWYAQLTSNASMWLRRGFEPFFIMAQRHCCLAETGLVWLPLGADTAFYAFTLSTLRSR